MSTGKPALPTGASGGSAEVITRFNPKQQGALAHAGCFNDNVYSIAAGCAAMSEIYTSERVAEFLDWSGAFRLSLDGMLVCSRGDLFLSLPLHDEHLAWARRALQKFADRYKPLIEQVLAA
jgi:glutamate-1-semialdehyde aminotransferase